MAAARSSHSSSDYCSSPHRGTIVSKTQVLCATNHLLCRLRKIKLVPTESPQSVSRISGPQCLVRALVAEDHEKRVKMVGTLLPPSTVMPATSHTSASSASQQTPLLPQIHSKLLRRRAARVEKLHLLSLGLSRTPTCSLRWAARHLLSSRLLSRRARVELPVANRVWTLGPVVFLNPSKGRNWFLLLVQSLRPILQSPKSQRQKQRRLSTVNHLLRA